MEKQKMSEEARAKMREYYRHYREQNKERIKEYNRRYWEKKAAEAEALKAAAAEKRESE